MVPESEEAGKVSSLSVSQMGRSARESMSPKWHRRKWTYSDGERMLWHALIHLLFSEEHEAYLWLRDFIKAKF